MKEFGVGIIGFGTIGAGVAEILQKHQELIRQRTNLSLVVRKIADLDLERDRGVQIDRSLLTRDAEAVINDPGVHIVVELIGGTRYARELILKALKAGKPVVTANKALLAEHGAEIFATAKQYKTDIYFEASVAGGIPIIKALREGLLANQIESIYGILNGTCNYILTRMEDERLPFECVLTEAQAAGYAEADPALDIDGVDAAHKTAILATLAYGFVVPMQAIQVQGIRGMASADIAYAHDLGYRIKLLSVIKCHDGELELGVQPTLIPLDHPLATVNGVYNAVLVRGDIVGNTMYYGRGAGRYPTTSAVISDIADVALNLASGSMQRVPSLAQLDRYGQVRPAGASVKRCYLRMSLTDKPGTLAKVAGILGQHAISISSLIQQEKHTGRCVPVVILTHEATEKQYAEAIAEIGKMDIVGAPTIRLSIEDFASPN